MSGGIVGGGVQTQLAEDSAVFTVAASTDISIQPAAGEFDHGKVLLSSTDAVANDITCGLTDGSILSNESSDTTQFASSTIAGSPVIDSTNTIFFHLTNTAAENDFLRSIITMSEET